MKSHVQNSQVIIKQFRSYNNEGDPLNDGKIFTLNFKDKKIELKSSKFIGVKKNYYNEKTEKFLSANYETFMGNFISELQSGTVILTNEKKEKLEKYLTMLCCRHPIIHNSMKNYQSPLLTNEIHLSPSDLIFIADKSDLPNTFFKDLNLVIVKNYNKRSFVSSVIGYSYYLDEENNKNWWFPLTPKIGIFFVTSLIFKNWFNNHIYVNIDDNSVKIFNTIIYNLSKQNNDECVFSNDEEELNRLLNL